MPPSAQSATVPAEGKAGKYGAEEFAKAQRTAQGRLYPSITTRHYLVLSNRRKHMQEFFRRQASGFSLLDVGAQYCPYYPLFKDKCSSYTSLDIVDTPIVDVVCNAEQMPLGDNLYDLALCTQVLEHCQNPQAIVNECHRVLRPGGTLVVTVPCIFPQHGYPADNWRFMPDGLRYLLRAFSRVAVLGELDLAESLVSVNCYYGHVFLGRAGRLGKMMAPAWNGATNVVARMLSPVLRPLTHSNFTSFTMNLWAEAVK